MLSERQLTRRQEGLELQGNIPVVTATFGHARENINQHIEGEIVGAIINEARRIRARSVTFSHEVFYTDEVVSLVLYAEMSTTIVRTFVRSINFSTSSGALVAVDEAAGLQVSHLAERVLAEMIRQNPEHYSAAVSTTLREQDFYLTNDAIVFLFDEFRLSSRDEGVARLTLQMSNLRTHVLTPDEYHVREEGYSLKRIPMRNVVNALGFSVRNFNSDEMSLEIWMGDLLVVSLVRDDSTFILMGVERQLEEGPLTIDGRWHVPITFFDSILPFTTYSVDSSGNITFVSYITD